VRRSRGRSRRALAPKLGLHVMFVDVHSSDQFESAFAAMMQQGPDALSVTADAFHMSHVEWVIDFAAKHLLPAMYIVRDNVAAGGLISYGPSISDLYRRAASYVHKILEGAKPAELPVEQPVKFELELSPNLGDGRDQAAAA
jgi:putative tryptophan/tyrosine transport system substrate-binding protein